MTHLTLTGLHAGRPLCDCDRERASEKGDRFTHWQYCGEKLLRSPEVCGVCLYVQNTADSDNDAIDSCPVCRERIGHRWDGPEYKTECFCTTGQQSTLALF